MAGVVKVTLNGTTLIDISDSTIDPSKILISNIGYEGDGDRVVGTLPAQVSPADFSGTGTTESLSVTGLEVGVWYAFACFNGRDSGITYSSGLVDSRTTGGSVSIMDADGSSSSAFYMRCIIGRTSSSTVKFTASHSSNIRIRWIKIGNFGEAESNGTNDFTPPDEIMDLDPIEETI